MRTHIRTCMVGLAVPALAAGLLLSACGPGTSGPGSQPTAILGSDPSTTQHLVNGTEAWRKDYPYFVKLLGCGGSVIAPTWVLTAAHCVNAATASVTNYNDQTVSGPVTVHPLWNGNTTDGHDLALVQVTTAFTAGITPIQVGEPATLTGYAAGTAAKIMGRGQTSGSDPSTYGQFHVADTVIHSDDYMDDIYNPLLGADHWIDSLMIGAGDSGNGPRTCYGDSGGPLVVGSTAGRPAQVGVSSFTRAGCTKPGAFAELNDAQLAWVASVVTTVPPAWSLCRTPNHSGGRMTPSYGTTIQQGPGRDGSRYWNLICVHGDAGIIQARHSGLCANVTPEAASTNGRVLVQGSCGVGLYGIFERVPKPGGYYWLVVAATGKCLAVHDGSTSPRARVVQADCTTGDHRLWSVTATDSGYYEIRNRNSQKPPMCLDVEGDYTTVGVFVWQYECDQGYNQQFRFAVPKKVLPTIEVSPPIGNR